MEMTTRTADGLVTFTDVPSPRMILLDLDDEVRLVDAAAWAALFPSPAEVAAFNARFDALPPSLDARVADVETKVADIDAVIVAVLS